MLMITNCNSECDNSDRKKADFILLSFHISCIFILMKVSLSDARFGQDFDKQIQEVFKDYWRIKI